MTRYLRVGLWVSGSWREMQVSSDNVQGMTQDTVYEESICAVTEDWHVVLSCRKDQK